MWKNIASNALTLIILLLVALGGVLAWGQNQYRTAGPLEAPICVRVEPGSNFRRVSEELAEQGAVTNSSILRLGADYTDKTSQLKAGSFLVPAAASMEEIVDLLTRGGASTCGTEVVFRVGVNGQRVEVRELDPATGRFVTEVEFDPVTEPVAPGYREVREEADTRYRVAVAEGVTSWQVVEALKSADFLEGSVEEVPPEGSLAPDSYEVRDGTPKAELLDRMAEAQELRLAEAWANRVDGLPLESPEEALILASIIEKETAVPEERRTVASVFVNRLNRGMRLQTDPTVIYGVTEGRGVLGRGIRQSELRDENPWNTYVIDGLPVTAIANPGLASIEAALDPADTNLIFFVADGTGGHAFAETLEEHNENVARWREIERQRDN
ncbi:MAG: endolytic transglycosylase MltG [Pseudomonadota bacterium]